MHHAKGVGAKANVYRERRKQSCVLITSRNMKTECRLNWQIVHELSDFPPTINALKCGVRKEALFCLVVVFIGDVESPLYLHRVLPDLSRPQLKNMIVSNDKLKFI
ncbi:hypothetical protein HUJ04_012799 [Dendroctonus ponderosae]|nr:hypothetical protein HUJ04_012799 [Dendroctonus ponderosae]KAH1030085.1 hypothetical protein HUJ05_003213 [Dendroctonus ponderosae]